MSQILALAAKTLSACVALGALSWSIYRNFRLRRHEADKVSADAPPRKPRNRFRVAVVDDEVEERFKTGTRNALAKRGFVIDFLEDVNSVQEVFSYQIVLCDIRGVGRNLGINRNGHGGILVSELRKMRPLTYLILYSAETFNPAFNRYFALADEVQDKRRLTGEDLVDVLDRAISTLSSPRDQWLRFKKFVLRGAADDISPRRMRKIHKSFMSAAAASRPSIDDRLSSLDLTSSQVGEEAGVAAEWSMEAADLADKLIELLS